MFGLGRHMRELPHNLLCNANDLFIHRGPDDQSKTGRRYRLQVTYMKKTIGPLSTRHQTDHVFSKIEKSRPPPLGH